MQGIESLGYEVRDQPLVPDGGMQQLKGAADLLAEFGRNGDTYVVHAAEGETVLPMEVLESSPKLKKMIYAQMEELGLQPERYVIGNELNSLNPVTGQPEFFFKKLFKKIKKVGKKVISLAKKVAPIVLPLIAPILLPAAPLFLTAGLGSLAGNLIAGNDFKTSLKNAVLAGGMAGIGSALSAGSLSGFTNDATGITSKLGEFFGQAPAPVSPNLATATGEFGGSAFGVSADVAPMTKEVFAGLGIEDIGLDTATSTGIASNQVASMDPNFSGLGMEVPTPIARTGAGLGDRFQAAANISPIEASMAPPAGVTLNQTMPSGQLAGAPPELFNPNFQAPMSPDATVTGVGAEMSSGAFSPNVVPSETARQAAVTGLGPDIPTGDTSVLSNIFDKGGDLFSTYLSPNRPGVGEDAGVLTKYGPLLAVGGAGILAADALFPPEEQERLQLGDGRTGQDLLDEDIRSGRFQYGFNPRDFYGNNPYYQRGQFTRARQGGQIDGPGTGTSDSIPAMLSDGEFVMTAKAVRGAGGNDRKEGAKKMYAMMRKFENEAVA
jgi:hypothetical protein